MNKIVIELCPVDRARLDAVAGLLEELVNCVRSNPEAAHPAGASTAHLEPQAPASDPAPAVKSVSLGEFQKAIVVRCTESPEMKAKVQDLVRRYADSVSAIPEGKRAEVLAALAGL